MDILSLCEWMKSTNVVEYGKICNHIYVLAFEENWS